MRPTLLSPTQSCEPEESKDRQRAAPAVLPDPPWRRGGGGGEGRQEGRREGGKGRCVTKQCVLQN